MTTQHPDPGPAGIGPERTAEVVPLRSPESLMSETTLVARAQDGDLAAFEQLVRNYQTPLYRLAYRMLFDRVEAEDAVQDSLVLAWRKLVTLADPQAFRAWIYNLTTRRCLNLIRARQRTHTTLGGTEDFAASIAELRPASEAGDPARAAQARGLHQGLEQALSGLAPELRVCWVLKELQDLSYPDIAGILGVPVSTVRGRLARARTELAKGMASWQ